MQHVSVVILTKNEEATIRRAIDSVGSLANEVVVIDTYSADRTVEIAEAAGAIVHKQEWLGWVGQRRRGAELAANDWVFFIDADEIVSEELSASIVRQMSGSPDPDSGFVVQRDDEFLGQLMFNTRRRSKRTALVRLYNRTRSDWRSDVIIHEEVRCPGSLITLRGKLIHWRNYTIASQFATYNRNSDLEAKSIISQGGRFLSLLILFKPALRFLWVYLKCGHWRLGVRGYIWACLNAIAEFLRLAKAWESRYAQATPNPPFFSVVSVKSRNISFSDAALAEQHLVEAGFQQATFVWRKENMRARVTSSGKQTAAINVEIWDATSYASANSLSMNS